MSFHPDPLQRHRTVPDSGPFRRHSCSWEDNGRRFTSTSVHFASPNFQFRMSRGTAVPYCFADIGANHGSHESDDGARNKRSVRNRVIPDSLHDLLSSRAPHPELEGRNVGHNGPQLNTLSDDESGELSGDEDDHDEGAYHGNAPRTPRSPSLISRLMARVFDTAPRTTRASAEGTARPRSRASPTRKHRSEQSTRDTYDRSARKAWQHAIALQTIIDREKKQREISKRRLRYALQNPDLNHNHFFALLNQMGAHEQVWARARRELEKHERTMEQAGFRSPTQSKRPASAMVTSDEFEDIVDDIYEKLFRYEPFRAFGSDPRDPIFDGEEIFARNTAFPFHGNEPTHTTSSTRFKFLFDGDNVFSCNTARGFPFSGSRPPNTPNDPRRAKTFHGSFHTRPASRRRPNSYSTQTGPVQEPPNPPTGLQREDPKLLFATYEQKWNALPSTDANVPFPCRGLRAENLNRLDTPYARNARDGVAGWSNETIMQANTQAFFLAACGLTPRYIDRGGGVDLGFDQGGATPTQVKQLIGILKKEKVRWHSDRLGQRNAGMNGPNYTLQRDERARAVFHAVCELIKTAQDWLNATQPVLKR